MLQVTGGFTLVFTGTSCACDYMQRNAIYCENMQCNVIQ